MPPPSHNTRGAAKRPALIPKRRPGGRSRRVHEAVIAAVVEALVHGGLDAVSIPEVAKRAGVNPTSIYRRWGSREALVSDVLAGQAELGLSLPDTGSVRSDLTAYLNQTATFLQSPYGSALLQLAAVAMGRPELQVYRSAYLLQRLKPIRTLLDRALARHEIRPGVDETTLVEALVGPLYARLLFTGRSIDSPLLDTVVTQALHTIARDVDPPRARNARRPRAGARP